MVDSICALSTPQGRAALAIIRISGPRALLCVEEMGAIGLEPRTPRVCVLRDEAGLVLDECLLTYFKAPNSFTGEDLVEIGAHGNPLIVQKIIDEIVSRETMRIALPGEFTARALANGKLSFDQVESMDWILNSTSSDGIRRGLQSKLEGLGSSTNLVTEAFTNLITDLQAQLDFSEDEVGAADRASIGEQMDYLISQLESWVRNFDGSRHLFQNWVVVLAGPPNSGKSSLFNQLIGADKAIVFDQPGTTRDFIEQETTFDGVGVVLIDTAGIRDTSDAVELIGIQKTRLAMKRADLICWIDDKGLPPPDVLVTEYHDKRWLRVHTKSDLWEGAPVASAIAVSSITGDGVNDVKAKMIPQGPNSTQFVPLTSTRQRNLVHAATESLKSARSNLEAGQYLDMVTEQLLMGARAVRAIVEPPDNETVLRRIFSRFCIGK